MFILLGHIPYDGNFVIGLFDTVELASQGRKEFRQQIQDSGQVEQFDSYGTYELTPNTLDGQVFNRIPVDTFQPGRQVKVHFQ